MPDIISIIVSSLQIEIVQYLVAVIGFLGCNLLVKKLVI